MSESGFLAGSMALTWPGDWFRLRALRWNGDASAASDECEEGEEE